MKSCKKICYRLIQEIACLTEICERPGCHRKVSAGHHVFGRRHLGSAFEPDGILSLCFEDHDGWARKNPSEVHAVLAAKIGLKRYEELRALTNKVCRMRDLDFLETAARLGLILIERRDNER